MSEGSVLEFCATCHHDKSVVLCPTTPVEVAIRASAYRPYERHGSDRISIYRMPAL